MNGRMDLGSTRRRSRQRQRTLERRVVGMSRRPRRARPGASIWSRRSSWRRAAPLPSAAEEGWRLESAECWLVSGNPILLSGQPAKPILAHELNGPLNGLNGARNGLDAVLFHPFRQFKRGFDRLNGSTVYSTAQLLNRTGWRHLPFRRV